MLGKFYYFFKFKFENNRNVWLNILGKNPKIIINYE